jgi:hypothetical protein
MRPLIFLLCTVPTFLFSTSIQIGPNGDFDTLSDAAPFANPGDSLVLEATIFSDGTQFIEDLNGTVDDPIYILGQEGQTIFRGGTEAIHLINCSYVVIQDIIIEQQTGNGINIDDGGDYSTPTHHIIIRYCIFRDMAASGNHDLLKLSGLDDFIIEDCEFYNGGDGGSGIDMVGCHQGVIKNCLFDNAGVSGIQAKGGTEYITIYANLFMNISQRAINIGGSTGLQFFRPPLPDPIVDASESKAILVYSNVFYRNWASVAFVGTIQSKVINNTIIQPLNWVFRILQETTNEGFLTCSDNTFANNIIYMESDLTEVNIGPNTAPETFYLTNNLWYNESNNSWSPNLPVTDINQIIQDPRLVNADNPDYLIAEDSPAIGAGLAFPEVLLDIDAKPFLDPPTIGAYEAGVVSSLFDQTKKQFTIYPNPTSDHLCIDMNEVENGEYTLHDLQGRLILAGKLTNNCFELTDLKTGIYILKFGPELIYHQKIIIEKK